MLQSVETGRTQLHESQYQFGRLIHKINQRIAAGDDSKSILDFLFDSLDSIIPYDRIGIALVEKHDGPSNLRSKWLKSKMPIGNLGVGYSGPLDGSSLRGILETGRPRIISNLLEYGTENPLSASTKLAIADGIRSSLTCPLYLKTEPIGVVFFSSGATDTYKTQHIETFLEIADELSFVITQDRNRQKAAELKSVGQNAQMLLHDLKSPLAVIQGFLQLARDEAWFKDLGEDAKHIFSTLTRNATHMGNLLNELAELNQLNADPQKNEISEISLQPFISEIAIAGAEMAEKKSIHFVSNIHNNLPKVFCFDGLKIRRVLDNLISNAVKYSKRETTVELTVGYEKDHLRFEVHDEGQGIPTDELHKLFQEFGKTSVRPTEGEGSSGLGLAISKKIVEQHGGQISVCSDFGKVILPRKTGHGFMRT